MAEEGACGRCRAVTVKHGATEGVCGGHQDHACAHGAACCGCWRWHDTVSSRTSPWASAVHPDAATASFLRRCPYLLPVEGDYGLKEQRFLFMYSSFFFLPVFVFFAFLLYGLCYFFFVILSDDLFLNVKKRCISGTWDEFGINVLYM